MSVLPQKLLRNFSVYSAVPRLVSRPSTFSPIAILSAMSGASHDLPTFDVPARMNNPVEINTEFNRIQRSDHELVYCF